MNQTVLQMDSMTNYPEEKKNELTQAISEHTKNELYAVVTVKGILCLQLTLKWFRENNYILYTETHTHIHKGNR